MYFVFQFFRKFSSKEIQSKTRPNNCKSWIKEENFYLHCSDEAGLKQNDGDCVDWWKGQLLFIYLVWHIWVFGWKWKLHVAKQNRKFLHDWRKWSAVFSVSVIIWWLNMMLPPLFFFIEWRVCLRIAYVDGQLKRRNETKTRCWLHLVLSVCVCVSIVII